MDSVPISLSLCPWSLFFLHRFWDHTYSAFLFYFNTMWDINSHNNYTVIRSCVGTSGTFCPFLFCHTALLQAINYQHLYKMKSNYLRTSRFIFDKQICFSFIVIELYNDYFISLSQVAGFALWDLHELVHLFSKYFLNIYSALSTTVSSGYKSGPNRQDPCIYSLSLTSSGEMQKISI